jgi:hypothetical protein
MKRLLQLQVILALLGFSFLISSCTEDHYYDKDRENEPDAYWGKYVIDVPQNQWRWDGNRECYYYEATPAPTWLTEYIANNGVVLALIDDGNTFYPLPHVAHYYQPMGASGYFFTETISYEFDVNYLRFNVAASDLYDNTDVNYQPQSYRFQVRLVW